MIWVELSAVSSFPFLPHHSFCTSGTDVNLVKKENSDIIIKIDLTFRSSEWVWGSVLQALVDHNLKNIGLNFGSVNPLYLLRV